MADVTLSYKGSDILELSDSGSATLKTGGKYCEDDIAVEYVKPSGGGGVKRVTGTYTPANNSYNFVVTGVDLGDWTFLCLEVRAQTSTIDKSGFFIYGEIAHAYNEDKLEYSDVLTSTTTQNGTSVTHSIGKTAVAQSRKNVLYGSGGNSFYDGATYRAVNTENNNVVLSAQYNLAGGVTYDFVLHYV